MKNYVDESGTTSRRTFTKTIAAALAAIPFASSLVNAQRKRRPTKPITDAKPKREAAYRGDSRNEHDTPPPILMEMGSFKVETERLFDAIEENPGMRKKNHINPNGTDNRVFPAHVKIVDGSGEMLFRYDVTPVIDTAGLQDKLRISILFTGGTVVNVMCSPISGNRQTFFIDTDETIKLTAVANTDIQPDAKRQMRYRPQLVSGAVLDATATRLTVTREERDVAGAVVMRTLYDLIPANLASAGKELRIMIWLEGRRA